MEQSLMSEFSRNKFKKLYLDDEVNTKEFVPSSLEGDSFSISYPGYKTKIKGSKIAYDYRVNLKKDGELYLPTHVNILLDIYNKARQDAPLLLRSFLIALAKEGNDIDLSQYDHLDYYGFEEPDEDLFKRAEKVHKSLKKFFSRKCNSWNYSVKELAYLISWIALQEEINYPMGEGYQGMRMPFYRYLEAIFVAVDKKKTIEDVMYRALSHIRPNLWVGLEVNYSPIMELG